MAFTPDYTIANASGAAVRGDLNTVFSAIKSNNSQSTDLTTSQNDVVAYQWWADTSATNAMKLRNSTNTDWVELFKLDGSIKLGSQSAPTIRFTGDSNTGIFSPGADQVAITTGGTQRATVDGSGRLLVGTSSWSGDAKLIVRANVSNSLGEGSFGIVCGSAATSINSGDTVGNLDFMNNAGGLYGRIAVQADAAGNDGDHPGRLVFSTTPDTQSAPTERMRIGQNGYLKASNTGSYVATANAFHELVGNAGDELVVRITNTHASSPYGVNFVFQNASPNNATNYFWNCADSSASRAMLRSNGGLANYSANNANLSDRNAKKDISPAADTWNCIKEWEIVNYRYKDQPDDADLNLGVIAQQVAESCPEVITVFSEAKDAKLAVLDDDGNEVEPAQEAQPEKLGVKEQQMYWMAIKALQEAQVRIEQLEAKVAALEPPAAPVAPAPADEPAAEQE